MLHCFKVMSKVPIYQTLLILGVVLVTRADDQVDWRVLNKIEDYGDNLTLICTFNNTIENNRDTVSKRWSLNNNKLCSLNNQPTDKTKYKAVVDTESVKLTILNFTKEDVNHAYHCEIGFYTSEKLVLSFKSVFIDKEIPLESDESGSTFTLTVVCIVAAFLFLILIGYFVFKKEKIFFKVIFKDEHDSEQKNKNFDLEEGKTFLHDENSVARLGNTESKSMQ